MRRILPVCLLLCAAVLGSSPGRARAQTLYATTVAASSTNDWINESRAAGEPTADCSNNLYSYNDLASSTDWLEATAWDAFGIPAGYRISRVQVDVHGRYDQGTNGAALRMRVRGTVTSTQLDSPTWNQTTVDCRWRMGPEQWDITGLKPAGWTAGDIAGLQVAVQRKNFAGRCRIEGFRISVTLEGCLPGLPTLTVTSPVCGILRFSWPATANTSSYYLYQYGVPFSPALYGNVWDWVVPEGSTQSGLAIQAFGPCGASGLSAEQAATANGPVPAPASLAIVASGCGVVRLQWNAVSGTSHLYRVYRDGAVLAAQVYGTNYDDATAGSGVHCYEVSAFSSTGSPCAEGARSPAACGSAALALDARQIRRMLNVTKAGVK